MKRTTLAACERLMQNLHDAQRAVEKAEMDEITYESEGKEWPGNAPFDSAIERREEAIEAIVQAVESWTEEEA